MIDYFLRWRLLLTTAKVGKQVAGGEVLGMCGKKEGCLGIGTQKLAVHRGVVTQEGSRIFVFGPGINLPGRTLLDKLAILEDQDFVCPGEDVDRIM
jgi:hypothetical protein